MELFRLHAYAVVPQRTIDDAEAPVGGAISVNSELRSVMAANMAEASFDDQPLVDFDMNTTTRTNYTRDAVMTFAFGEPATAKAAAVDLAERLSLAMDRRSAPCLFVPSAFREAENVRVILWIFPREDAFQLRESAAGPTIKVLTDVFSQKSRHRKAASFDGRNLKTEFMQGRVLDHLADEVSRHFADFWVSRFLECVLSMHDEAGTRLLAKTVRLTYDALETAEEREQMHSAVMAVRNSPQRRVSLYTFAERYLDGETKDSFIKKVRNEHALHAAFNLDRSLFDETLRFRVFELERGVFVSSPLSEIGDTVKIIGSGDSRRLTCQGQIVDEKLRTRHV